MLIYKDYQNHKKMTKTEIITGLNLEIDRNLYLQESEKKAWRQSLDKYPTALLLYFFKLLKTENDKNSLLIKKALKINPEIVNSLKGSLQKTKIQLIAIQESEKDIQEKKDLENNLLNQL